MQSYTSAAFIQHLAAKIGAPVMALQTRGSGASSLRYHEIPVPQETRDELYNNDLAFLTFADNAEATAAFEAIVEAYPEQSTLSLTVALGLPGLANLEF